MKAALQEDWLINAQMIVCPPHVDDTDRRHRIVDGAHRYRAILDLCGHSTSAFSEKWKNFEIPVVLLPQLTRQQELTLAYCNIHCFYFNFF